jgi:TatA/E family protein of Tat protein translocase
MEGLSPLHLVIVLVIAVLVLGPGKLPEVGSALGKSIREFRKATLEIQESVRLDASPTQTSAVVPAPASVTAATPASAAQPAAVEAGAAVDRTNTEPTPIAPTSPS